MQASSKKKLLWIERVKLGKLKLQEWAGQPAKRSYYGILNKLAHMSLHWHADVT